MCAILLWSSLVPTVLAIKRFMCVSKSRPSSRIILGARMCFIGQIGPWFDIPVWHTHLMHSFDGDLRHRVIFRLVVNLAPLCHHSNKAVDK